MSLYAVTLQFPNLFQYDDAPEGMVSEGWSSRIWVSFTLYPTDQLQDELELESPYPTSAPQLTNALLAEWRQILTTAVQNLEHGGYCKHK